MREIVAKILNFFSGTSSAWIQKDMNLRSVEAGKKVDVELHDYSTKKVEWVRRETDVEGDPVDIWEPEEIIMVPKK